MSTELHNKIKDKRERLGLTQADLAQMCDVSRKTINTIENRVFIPSSVLAIKISRALICTFEEVFWLEE